MTETQLPPEDSQQAGCQPRFVRPVAARVCPSCSSLVTTAEKCPLCRQATLPHPDRNITEDYCIACGEGPFPADKLHVKTWDEDPYSQTEDGDLATLCERCHKEEVADDE